MTTSNKSHLPYPTEMPQGNYTFPNPPINNIIKNNIQNSDNGSIYGESFKPKKAGTKTSHVIFVLDYSSSMQSCKESTISGFNEFLDTQAKDEKDNGIKTYVSLYIFDGQSVKCSYACKHISKVDKLTTQSYDPSGTTNLYDAIGGVILNLNKDLESKKKKERDSIIVSILTDGQENCSQSFSQKDIKYMIEKAEAKNWGFIFLGANIDSFSVGKNLGFTQDNIMQYNTTKMENTMRAASNMTSRMKSAYAQNLDTKSVYEESAFTDTERKGSV